MEKKKIKNEWIIRKSVIADDIHEALKKEKNAKILDIVLVASGGNTKNPVIGFIPSQISENDVRDS